MVSGQQLCELKSGTFSNGYTATSTQAIAQQSHDGQVSVGGKWTSGALKLSTDLTYTDSSFRESIFIIDTSFAGQTYDLVSNDQGGVNWNIHGNAQNNANNFGLQGLFQTGDENHGDSVAWRSDATYDFETGLLKSITGGVRLVRRNASASGETQISTGLPTPGTPAVPVFGQGFFESTPDQLGFAGIRSAQTPNIDYLFHNQAAIRTYYGLPTGPAPEDPTRAYAAAEKSYAGYVQAAFGLTVAGVPVDGLAGVRVVKNDRKIDATLELNGNYTPIHANTSDTDVLPNVSLRAHLTDKLQARFSYAKTASRPDFGSLNPSLSLAPPTVNRLGYGSGGNPDLKEITSQNIDAALEWYFNRAGSVTATIFHRDIDGYIQNYSSQESFSGVQYTVTRPESAGSGYLQGAEIAYQQFYTFLPGALSGLGLQVNYTYIDNLTQAPLVEGGASVVTPLANVSKHNGNAVLMYEKYGLSARLAYNYRGKFIDSVNPGGAQFPPPNPTYNVIKAQNHLDFSLAYDATPHLTLTLDATNLTGERAYEYLESPLLPQHVRLEDQTISAGVRVKF
jgi:TonB-dependent receptor